MRRDRRSSGQRVQSDADDRRPRLTLTQTGLLFAGNVEFGTVVIPATGSVNASGALSLTGQTHFGGQAPGTFSLSNWNTTRSGTTLNGGFTISFCRRQSCARLADARTHAPERHQVIVGSRIAGIYATPWARFLARRLVLTIPVLLGVATLVFSLIHLIPGDPAQAMLGEAAPQADVEALRQPLGLDRPLLEQYGTFLAGWRSGDLGTSLRTGQPVTRPDPRAHAGDVRAGGRGDGRGASAFAIPLGIARGGPARHRASITRR